MDKHKRAGAKVYRTKQGKYTLRLTFPNGKVLAQVTAPAVRAQPL